MRILLVSDHYPPFIGGAHRQTRLLAHELHRRGHDVGVATPWQPGAATVEDDDGVPVHRLRQLRNVLTRQPRSFRQQHQPPFVDPVTTWALRRLIDRLQPEVIHSYGWISFSCAAALRRRSIPLLVSGRDYGYACATRTLYHQGRLCDGPALRKCLHCAAGHYGTAKGWTAVAGIYLNQRLLTRRMSAFHSISTIVREMARRDLLGHGPRNLIEAVIPSFGEDEEPAVEPDDARIRRYLERLPPQPFVLFVGALRRVKGIGQLLAAYERLATSVPLVLIGTIERDSPTTFPSWAIVLEEFPHEAVLAAWDRALFGVFPSTAPEPLGNVVYEAMSRGKAVIGTTPSGHEDAIVDGESGLLVPAGDVDALAAALRTLMDDEALCQRLGRAGRARADRFKAAVVVPQFERLYAELVRRRIQATGLVVAARPRP